MQQSADELPLSGIRVIEFTHMVMGPTAGMILADLGAEVFKIEPLGGDKTRRLQGSGAGYFPMYNRNKKSICIDLKSERGRELAQRLVPAPTCWSKTPSRADARWVSAGKR